MNSLTLNLISGKTYSSKTSKASSKSEWNLSDSLKDKITKLAQEDAKSNIYMNNQFIALEHKEVSKVSPDRSAAMAKATAIMNNSNNSQSVKLEDTWDKWLSKLLDLPYKAQFETSSSGTYAHLYDENGDEFASFTPSVGWQTCTTKEENRVYDSMAFTYYDAYHTARQDIKAENTVKKSNSSEVSNTCINTNNKVGVDIRA